MQDAVNTNYEWLTVTEFCQRFRLSTTLVYKQVSSGSISSIRVGGKILIRADALDTLLKASDDAKKKT